MMWSAAATPPFLVRNAQRRHGRRTPHHWVMAVALMTFFVGTFFLSESHRVEIWKEAEGARPA